MRDPLSSVCGLAILSATCGALAIGCSHASSINAGPAPGAHTARVMDAADEPELPPVMRPSSQLEARAMLQEAFEASAADEVRRATGLISAVLATDFLTDRGRANLYWLVADGRLREGDIAAHFEGLGMFLLAADLIEDDDELRARKLLARSVLAARRVATEPEFGRTPDRAIDVEDHREPTRIFAAIPCGPTGEGRFIDVETQILDRAGHQLVHHTARCDSDLGSLSLWFDVTHAGR